MRVEHPVFRGPLFLDTKTSSQAKTPSSWKSTHPSETIPVFRVGKSSDIGWCTNGDSLRLPEAELLCGGRNSKGAHFAAVWRQGAFLHFGFHLAPDAMTEFGKGLLVNCVDYIARCGADRASARASSPYFPGWKRARYIADRLVHREDYAERIPALFDASALEAFDAKNVAAFRAWYDKKRGFLYPAAAKPSVLALDKELVRFGVSYDDPGFVPSLVAALQGEDKERTALAQSLLERFIDAPPKQRSAAAWRAWLAANGDALYFSDGGGFRFYVDVLAKKRGVTSKSLRGPARAARD